MITVTLRHKTLRFVLTLFSLYFKWFPNKNIYVIHNYRHVVCTNTRIHTVEGIIHSLLFTDNNR